VTGTRSIISLGFNQIEQLSKYITDKGWFDTNSLTLLEAPLIQRPRNKVAETPPQLFDSFSAGKERETDEMLINNTQR